MKKRGLRHKKENIREGHTGKKKTRERGECLPHREGEKIPKLIVGVWSTKKSHLGGGGEKKMLQRKKKNPGDYKWNRQLESVSVRNVFKYWTGGAQQGRVTMPIRKNTGFSGKKK